MKKIVISLVLATSVNVAHAESAVVFAGFDVADNSDYIYVGGVARLGSTFAEDGWLARVMLSHLDFEFKDNNQKFKADGYGGSIAGGYSFVHPKGYTTLSIGVATRNLDYSNNAKNLSGIDDGTKTGVQLQAEVKQAINESFDIEGIANYTTNVDDYWARARVMYKATDAIRVGPELVGFGGDHYDAVRVGIAVSGIPFFGLGQLGANLGAEDKSSSSNSAYGGLVFSTSY